MTIEQAATLRIGDVVMWTDPDEGLCSKTRRIRNILIHGDAVWLTFDNGSEVEALAGELTLIQYGS